MTGIIAYQNLLESATVTASSETADYPARNAWDGITTTYWRPSGAGDHTLTAVFGTAVAADCFAVFRHNLASAGGTIVLQYSDDAGATWANCFSPLSLADDACRLVTFASLSKTHWRILVAGTTADLFLGAVLFGARLTLYRGLPLGSALARHSRETEVITNRAEGGAIIGRSVVRRGAKQEIRAQYVPLAWVRTYWEPFIVHAERKPFFYSWNNASYADDCVFGLADLPVPSMQQSELGFLDLQLSMTCLMSGSAQ